MIIGRQPPTNPPPMSEAPSPVEEISLPGHQAYAGQKFPLALAWRGAADDARAALAWLQEHRGELDAQATRHGALLFRGFPAATPEDFDAFIRAFDYPNFKYEDSLSNAVRVVRTE